MSEAAKVFDEAIRDAENLLQHFDTLNPNPPPPENEVLKRAGLVMAMTAWETYVEHRVEEVCEQRLLDSADATINAFVKARLRQDLKGLHNPNSKKTLKVFADYAGVDLRQSWSWPNCDEASVRDRLDAYMAKRGEVVHRSRPVGQVSTKHAVTREDLQKAINFLKQLVQVTERALDASAASLARTG